MAAVRGQPQGEAPVLPCPLVSGFPLSVADFLIGSPLSVADLLFCSPLSVADLLFGSPITPQGAEVTATEAVRCGRAVQIHWHSVPGSSTMGSALDIANRGQILFRRTGAAACVVKLTISYEVPDVLAPLAGVRHSSDFRASGF